MADLNKESMAIWKSLKPMIDEEIKAQTRGSVQRRKMKVTTAPSLVTNVIGVTEPYGTEMLIPFTTNLSAANVGDVVWVEFMYGATNAFASMYASADTKDWTVGGVLDVVQRRCFATLSSAGWYRVLRIGRPASATSRVIELTFTRTYSNTNNEVHCIKFIGTYNSFTFTDETSKSNAQVIDKIRYTKDSDYGYIDIHYSVSASNLVYADFNVCSDGDIKASCVSESLQSVADAPAGETVLATYDFFANSNVAPFKFTVGGKDWWFEKRDGVVYFNSPYDITSVSTGFTDIGTLPVGFRPRIPMYLPCGNNYTQFQMVVISTNGDVKFYTSTATSTARNCAFSSSWVAYS